MKIFFSSWTMVSSLMAFEISMLKLPYYLLLFYNWHLLTIWLPFSSGAQYVAGPPVF
jgi:hypothetical protein